MKRISRRPIRFPRLSLALPILFLLVAFPFFQLQAQSFSPTNVYNNWNGTNAFSTIPTVTGLTFTQITRGSGLTVTSATDGINASSWDIGTSSFAQAVTNNDYFSFTITANASTSFNVTSVFLGLRRSGTGPNNFQMEYSINNAPFAAYGSAYSSTSTSNFFQTLTQNISVPIGGNVVFRLEAYGATNVAGTLRVLNNTAINGTALGTSSISTTNVSPNSFCVGATAGSAVSVDYSATGSFTASNVFTAQLSDASGSFASPVAIGTLAGNALSGTINATIPAATPSGTGYRIRVVSNLPVVTGTDNGSDLSVLTGVDLSYVVSNINCNGAGNGSIVTTITGGVSPFTYLWSTSATTSSLNSLVAGTYSLTVTGNNGCTAVISSAVVTEPPALADTTMVTDILCNANTNGAINLSVTGGTSPYSFAWSNSANTQNISNLSAGTYSVLITDNNGCTHLDSAIVNAPAAITSAANVTDVLCNAGTNGSINLSVNGGTSPYSFAWNNSANTQNISNLSAGTYSVLITDNNGCTHLDSAIVNAPSAISSSANVTDALCNAGTNGSINLSVNGGTSPYSFAWSNSANTQNISNLSAGTYSVIVTDNNGCTHLDSAIVNAPSAINSSANVTDALCNAGTNGSINLSVNGGTSPYSFVWNNSATTQNISNLAAGTYSVLITDNNGCTQTVSTTVTEPSAITSSTSITNVLCNAGTNGAINLSVNGGTSPYSFSWNNSATTQNISNLAAGTYSVLITDNNGCTQTVTTIINEPSAITSATTVTNANCNGGSDGAITLSVNGGTSPYTFAWSNSANTQNISNLLAGTYSVLITDNNGCTQSATTTVNAPGSITTSTATTDVLCNAGANGAINLTVNGGTSPYSFTWNNSATTQNISNLTAGTYSVLIVDNNGCVQTTTVSITQPSLISGSIIATDVQCNGGNNGSINLSVSGGTLPYSFLWSNSATTQNISNLTAGNYSVTITDNNGCTQSASAVVNVPSAINASATTTNVQCNGGGNGSINLAVNGGTSPYTFAWSNSATTQNISNLTAGSYSVIITDNQGCTQTTVVPVTEPSTITDVVSSTNVLCNNAANGSINLTVNGGTFPYTFAWSNSATTQNISNLTAGTYSVVITDSHGCTHTELVSVTQPSPIVTSIDSTNASCGTCSDGSADLTVTGGTSPYTYAWSNGATTEDITGVLPGNYTVTVTDSNGCQAEDVITVNFSTAIAEVTTANSIQVFPNPSNGENIIIKTNENVSGAFTLVLYDVTGKEVFRCLPVANGNGTYQVALPLSNGTYLYRLVNGTDFLQSGKLIIIK